MSDRPVGKGLPYLSATLLACGFFAAVALLADGDAEHPAPLAFYAQPFGEPGDDTRAALIDSVGLGSYVLLAGWLTISFGLFRGYRWLIFPLRIVGWTLLVGSTALIADWAGPAEFRVR